jgi:pimeloyl-ACP methyl ester carboxylesterase
MLIKLESGQTFYTDNKVNTDEILIFIHGNSHDHKTFKNLLIRPEFTNHRLISYDLYGHGNSEKKDVYNLDLFVRQLVELKKALGLTDVYLIGHSLGGHIALQTFEKLNGCNGILTLGTPPLEKPLQNSPFKPHPAFQLMATEKITVEDAREIQKMLYNEIGIHLEYEIETILGTDSHFRTNFLASVINGEYEDEVEKIKVQTPRIKLLLGENDAIIERSYIELNFKELLTIIPSGPHNLHLSNTCLVVKEILNFTN